MVRNVTGGSITVIYNGTSPAVGLAGNGIAVTVKSPKPVSFSPVNAGSVGTPKSIVFSNTSSVTVDAR
jgi:hypothetical protein